MKEIKLERTEHWLVNQAKNTSYLKTCTWKTLKCKSYKLHTSHLGPAKVHLWLTLFLHTCSSSYYDIFTKFWNSHQILSVSFSLSLWFFIGCNKSSGCLFQKKEVVTLSPNSSEGGIAVFSMLRVHEFCKRKWDEFICPLFHLQEFEDYRDADDAVYELNGKELVGERYGIHHIEFVFVLLLMFL